MTNEEIAEAAKAYAPNSLALKFPTTIREYQKRDIESAFIAGAKFVIKKLSKHSQNQNSQTQQYPHWNRQDEKDIYDSFDDWNYHQYVCIMKDGQVSIWSAIRDEHYDGSIEKHIYPIEDDYIVDDILYWTELKIKNNI